MYTSIAGNLVVVHEEAATVELTISKFIDEHWGVKKFCNHLNICGFKLKRGDGETLSLFCHTCKSCSGEYLDSQGVSFGWHHL
jgi:hypothetical protein